MGSEIVIVILAVIVFYVPLLQLPMIIYQAAINDNSRNARLKLVFAACGASLASVVGSIYVAANHPNHFSWIVLFGFFVMPGAALGLTACRIYFYVRIAPGQEPVRPSMREIVARFLLVGLFVLMFIAVSVGLIIDGGTVGIIASIGTNVVAAYAVWHEYTWFRQLPNK